jgi:hypothetical protein
MARRLSLPWQCINKDISINYECKQVIKKLEEAGWVLSRVEGSHYIMEKEGDLRPLNFS